MPKLIDFLSFFVQTKHWVQQLTKVPPMSGAPLNLKWPPTIRKAHLAPRRSNMWPYSPISLSFFLFPLYFVRSSFNFASTSCPLILYFFFFLIVYLVFCFHVCFLLFSLFPLLFILVLWSCFFLLCYIMWDAPTKLLSLNMTLLGCRFIKIDPSLMLLQSYVHSKKIFIHAPVQLCSSKWTLQQQWRIFELKGVLATP